MRVHTLTQRTKHDWPSRPVMLVVALTTAVLVAACSDGDSASGPSALVGVPDVQRTILEDGVVTYGEFESSVYATTQCLEASGFTIRDLSIRSAGWSLSYSSPYDDVGEEDAAYKKCSEEYMSHVEPAYLSTIENPGDDPATTVMIVCLNDIGVAMEADATWSEIQAAADIDPVGWVQCRAEANNP